MLGTKGRVSVQTAEAGREQTYPGEAVGSHGRFKRKQGRLLELCVGGNSHASMRVAGRMEEGTDTGLWRAVEKEGLWGGDS